VYYVVSCHIVSCLSADLLEMVGVQDRDTQKTTWIAKFVEEVKNDRMVLPALKQIREICQLFSEVCQPFVM
jgi:hypothetical protein